MTKMNPEAETLNTIFRENNPVIERLLSQKGKHIYYPKMGMLKQGAEAKGKRINATVGMAMEDDGSPMRLSTIADLVQLKPTEIFPYASSFGVPELRTAWKNLIREKNPSLKEMISLPVVSIGLTHGLSIAGYLFADPGDEIIVGDVLWGNYNLIFHYAHGAELRRYKLFEGEGFNLQGLKKSIDAAGKKQIVLLNFPNNPTGYTVTNKEVESIYEILFESASRGNDILVITDDAYFGLVYEDDVLKESPFSRLAGLHENILALKIDGATKEDYAWGLRVGFLTYSTKGITEASCNAMEEKTTGVIRGQISNASHLSQQLLLNALHSSKYHEEKQLKYQLMKSRYDCVRRILVENAEKFSPFFTTLPFNSGYFMCLKLAEDIVSDTVRRLLLDKYNTGTVSVGNFLRIAFSSVAEKDLPELFDNILSACEEVRG